MVVGRALLLAVALLFQSSAALTLGVRATAPAMKVPTRDDVSAVPPQPRAEEPCAFFGGGKDVPEGAKCIFRPNAPCNRKKCQVNKGPCKNNHNS